MTDINVHDEDGNTTLRYLHDRTHLNFLSVTGKDECFDILQLLFNEGAEGHIKNKNGRTPLHLAASKHCTECVRLLLPLSDIHSQDVFGNTPFDSIHFGVGATGEDHRCLEISQLIFENEEGRGGGGGGCTQRTMVDLQLCILHPLQSVTSVSDYCYQKVMLTLGMMMVAQFCTVPSVLPVSDVNVQNENGETALYCMLAEAMKKCDQETSHFWNETRCSLAVCRFVSTRAVLVGFTILVNVQDDVSEAMFQVFPPLEIDAPWYNGNIAHLGVEQNSLAHFKKRGGRVA